MIRRPPRSPLFPYTTLFHTVHDQLELVQALEVRHLRLVSGLGQHLEAVLHQLRGTAAEHRLLAEEDRKSTRLNSSHANISYAVFCLKKKQYTFPVLVHQSVM